MKNEENDNAMMTDTIDTARISSFVVSAFVSKNSCRPGDLPGILASVHDAFRKLATGAGESAAAQTPLEAKVSIKKSITENAIICLYCGGGYKSLKRHLGASHQTTPLAYRALWGLPGTYPMVAPSYSATRSELAKVSGLGNKREEPEISKKPVRKSRSKKAAA